MKKYKVGINNMIYDQWDCGYVDKQYTVYVETDNKDMIECLAIEKCKNEYSGLLVSNYFDIAWVEESE